MVNRVNLSLFKTNLGNSLAELSDQSPVLIVFLRHFGCVFCKESLTEISKIKSQFDSKGIKLVLVHMSDYKTADAYFKKYKLYNPENLSDPECKIYATFGLLKGSFSQLFGLKTMIRGFQLATTKQIFPEMVRVGDGFQMPGIFLIKNAVVIESFIHNSVADKPNYQSFIQSCQLN